MRAGLSKGNRDVQETWGWLSEADDSASRGFTLYDDVAEAVRDGRQAGKSADEIWADVAAIRDETLKQADEITDPPVVSREAIGAEDIATSAIDLPPTPRPSTPALPGQPRRIRAWRETIDNAIGSEALPKTATRIYRRIQQAEEGYRLVDTGSQVAQGARKFGDDWGSDTGGYRR
jgi:hypothetical protein